MKSSRRNFLKLASSAFASLFAPKVKVEPDNQGASGIVSKPTGTIFDLMSDFNETVQTEADKPNVYAIVDETLPDETITEWQRYPVRDCQFDVQVHYDKCDVQPDEYRLAPEWEDALRARTWNANLAYAQKKHGTWQMTHYIESGEIINCGWDGKQCSLSDCPFSMKGNPIDCAYYDKGLVDVNLSDEHAPWARVKALSDDEKKLPFPMDAT